MALASLGLALAQASPPETTQFQTSLDKALASMWWDRTPLALVAREGPMKLTKFYVFVLLCFFIFSPFLCVFPAFKVCFLADHLTCYYANVVVGGVRCSDV
jgi:hypothetical protein